MADSVKIILEPDVVQAEAQGPTVELKDEEEAKAFLSGLKEFIGNGSMEKKAKEISSRTGLPAREVSKNFLLKTAGILGTALDIAVDTAGDVVATIINLIGFILLSGIELIIRTAHKLIRIVTLNQGVAA